MPSLHYRAFKAEDWEQLNSILETSCPDEDTIKAIVQSGLIKPVECLVRAGYALNAYGHNKRSILHYISTYANTDQLHHLAESEEWETLLLFKDDNGKTALDLLEDALDVVENCNKTALDIVESEQAGADGAGNLPRDIGTQLGIHGFNPWSEGMSVDQETMKMYLANLQEVRDLLRSDLNDLGGQGGNGNGNGNSDGDGVGEGDVSTAS